MGCVARQSGAIKRVFVTDVADDFHARCLETCPQCLSRKSGHSECYLLYVVYLLFFDSFFLDLNGFADLLVEFVGSRRE